MLNSKVSASTRDLTVSEKAYPPHKQLRWVASCSQLLILARRKLGENRSFQRIAARELDPNDEESLKILGTLHPRYTGMALPPILHSEADTTSWVNAKLAWPALYLIRLMKQRGTVQLGPEPYISSSEGKSQGPVPDAIIMDGHVKQIDEWKTGNAMRNNIFLDMYETLMDLEESKVGVPLRIWWDSVWDVDEYDNDDGDDDDGEYTPDRRVTKESKILFQVR